MPSTGKGSGCVSPFYLLSFSKKVLGVFLVFLGFNDFANFYQEFCWINGVSGSQLSAAAYYGDVLLAALCSIWLERIKEISRIKVLRGDSN